MVRAQLWWFGPGNGPGDAIVYLPDAQLAWTGNYLNHPGIAPMLLQGGPAPYLASLRRMRQALPELRTSRCHVELAPPLFSVTMYW